MFNFSQFLQQGFSGFDFVFSDYFRFWLIFGIYLIIFLALFDLFFRQ